MTVANAVLEADLDLAEFDHRCNSATVEHLRKYAQKAGDGKESTEQVPTKDRLAS